MDPDLILKRMYGANWWRYKNYDVKPQTRSEPAEGPTNARAGVTRRSHEEPKAQRKMAAKSRKINRRAK
jgi:hypothetical protein